MKKLISITIILVLGFTIVFKWNSIFGNVTKLNKSDSAVKNIPYSVRRKTSFAIYNKDIKDVFGKAEVTRKVSDYFYEIRTINRSDKLFVFYNSADNRVLDLWHFNKLLDFNDFKAIVSGKSTSNEVKRIDSNLIVFGSLDEGSIGVSEHKLKDNKNVLIEYKREKDSWVVSEVKCNDNDASNITQKILPEDLKLIINN